MPTPSVNEERVEIDTSLPFASVKAAITLFGEKVDLQNPKFQEKRKDVEFRQELAKLEKQLVYEENRKKNAMHELDQAMKLLEYIEKRTVETSSADGHVKIEDKLEQIGSAVEEKHVVWEMAAIEHHADSITSPDLKRSRQILSDLKSALLAAVKEKNAALEQLEKRLTSMQRKSQELDELKKELAGMNESLVLLKLACIEANRDKVSLLEDNHTDKISGNELEVSNGELQTAELEHKLGEAMKEMGELQVKLANIKGNGGKENAATQDAVEPLEPLQLELQRTKMADESASSSLVALIAELEEAKVKLHERINDIDTCSALQKSLQCELEMMKNELKSVKEREVNASRAASVLSGELSKIKAELPAAEASKDTAVESIASLSQAFEQVQAEATAAKAKADVLLAEAISAKNEAEQAKSIRENAESMLKKALEECNMAKKAEDAALHQLKSLSTKTDASRASGVEAGAGITISKDEHESLKRKVREAEELANMRIAAALAQIEAVRTSEQEIFQKLAVATEDIENIRTENKEALHRAELAEAAKTALDSELRRLREKEQKRREKETAITSQQLYVRTGGESKPSLTLKPTSSPLQNYSAELAKTDERVMGIDKKKQTVLKSFTSYLSRRKSFSSRSSLKH